MIGDFNTRAWRGNLDELVDIAEGEDDDVLRTFVDLARFIPFYVSATHGDFGQALDTPTSALSGLYRLEQAFAAELVLALLTERDKAEGERDG